MKSRCSRMAAAAVAAMTVVALVGAACGGGTSSGDKTATASGGYGAPTRAAATPAATKAAATPAVVATPSAGGAAAGVVKTGTTSLGTVLTDAAGKTLYTFDNDKTAGKSSCNGGCATTWPPVTGSTAPTVPGASGTFSMITRDDGSSQVAYNGKPLYRYAPDTAAGDTKGDGVGGVWHAAKP